MLTRMRRHPLWPAWPYLTTGLLLLVWAART